MGRERRGSRRLLVFALTVGAAVAPATVVAPTASAHHTGPCEWYQVNQDLGLAHKPVESRAVQNSSASSIPVTFTSSVAQTVSSTWNSSGTVAVNFTTINTTVSSTLGISTINSVTTTIGVNVGPVQVPPATTVFGDWGVFGRETQGTYTKMFACSLAGHTRPPYVASGVAFSPVAQGWKVWQQ